MKYLYLIKTRASVNIKENVYKIGRTNNFEIRKLHYMKGFKIFLLIPTRYTKKKEKIIINIFQNEFITRLDYGREFFEGNLKNLVKIIKKIEKLKKNELVKRIAKLTEVKRIKENLRRKKKYKKISKNMLGINKNELETYSEYIRRYNREKYHFLKKKKV